MTNMNKKEVIHEELIKCIAIDNGWEIAKTPHDNPFIRFEKDESPIDMHIDVWKSTGTVKQVLKPWGTTRFFKDNTEEDYKEIFSGEL